MAHWWARSVATVTFGGLVACVGGDHRPAVPPARVPAAVRAPATAEELALIATLAGLGSDAKVRALLECDFSARELNRVGFDDLSLEGCIDAVVAAVRDDRSGAGGTDARTRLVAALRLCQSLSSETVVRRRAGMAPCMPFSR